MSNLSRNAGWLLLAPETKEEERGWGGALVFLAFGGLLAAFGVGELFETPPELLDAFWRWAMALFFFVQAVLFSPSLYERPRVVLGVRVAVSVVAFAVMAVLLLTFYSDGFRFGMALMSALLVFILGSNYFVNRRRYRRSRPA